MRGHFRYNLQVSIGAFILSTREGLSANYGYETGTNLVTIRYYGMAGWWWFQILTK